MVIYRAVGRTFPTMAMENDEQTRYHKSILNQVDNHLVDIHVWASNPTVSRSGYSARITRLFDNSLNVFIGVNGSYTCDGTSGVYHNSIF